MHFITKLRSVCIGTPEDGISTVHISTILNMIKVIRFLYRSNKSDQNHYNKSK